MGTLRHFDLPAMVRRHNLIRFVETGTGMGESLAYAVDCRPPFAGLFSCEVNEGLAAAAHDMFGADKRVSIIGLRSSEFLEAFLPIMAPDEPILFWLDAHFPGADYGMGGYGDEPSLSHRLPLKDELALIASHRPKGRDVVVCDDLRIYTDGPFQHGPLPENVRPHCPAERSIRFAYDLMGSTHDVHLLHAHEGYLLLTPKEKDDG